MKPRLGQTLLGIVLGLLPFLVPVLFFLALAPGFRGALDFMASLPLSLPGLALAALLLVLVCQGFLYGAQPLAGLSAGHPAGRRHGPLPRGPGRARAGRRLRRPRGGA